MTATIAGTTMEPPLQCGDATWNEADVLGALTRIDDEYPHDDAERDQELKPQPWEW